MGKSGVADSTVAPIAIVKSAVASIATCTPATVLLLADLLLPSSGKSGASEAKSSKATRINPVKANQSRKTRAAPLTTKTNERLPADHCEELSPRERSILATEVINATLRSLGNAVKTPVPARRQPSSKDLVRAASRKVLRRSNSLPLSPHRPPSLSRVSSSPDISTRSSRSSSSVSVHSVGQRSTAECARVAFTCLRALQSSKSNSADAPALQLESGMSSLVAKLIALGFNDLAFKELKILKKRLEGLGRRSQNELRKNRPVLGDTKQPVAPSITLVDLFDFGDVSYEGVVLSLVISTQLHILKLMTLSKKAYNATSILSKVISSYRGSPLALIGQLAKDPSQAPKAGRYLETLSQLLLSMCPSVSSAEDDVALEAKLSTAPCVVIQLQSLAFSSRILCYRINNHQASVENEILEPFSRCLKAFARRSVGGSVECFRLGARLFEELWTELSKSPGSQQKSSVSPMISISTILGCMAQEAGLGSDAIFWIEKARRDSLSFGVSEARKCLITTRLVTLKIQKHPGNQDLEDLLFEVLESLEGSLKGESSALDDLLSEVSAARRAAITILSRKVSNQNNKPVSNGLLQLCESLVFSSLRYSLRYLGKKPDQSSHTKTILHFQQRRHNVARSALNSIDAVLYLLKTLITEKRITWQLMDTVLQDCLSLLAGVNTEGTNCKGDESSAASSSYVRISNMYYTQHLNMKRDTEGSKDLLHLRPLRRSIDCIRERTVPEKSSALFNLKLEHAAGSYNSVGRFDEAVDILILLRDELLDNGALKAVLKAADSQLTSSAWETCEEAALLGRTLYSLFRLQIRKSPSDLEKSASLLTTLSEEERGLILENLLRRLSAQAETSGATNQNQENIMSIQRALVKIYDPTNFPIRRLRLAAHMLHLTSEDRTELIVEAIDLGDLTNVDIQGAVYGRDAALSKFLPHLRALWLSVSELRKENPDMQVIEKCVNVWESIMKGCKDEDTLIGKIDDISNLLDHLHCISDYMNMKGVGQKRIIVLDIIVDVCKILPIDSHLDRILTAYCSLSMQYLDLGYSGKASLIIEKARTYSTYNGASHNALIQLHLCYADYLLVTGNYQKCEEALHRGEAVSKSVTDLSINSDDFTQRLDIGFQGATIGEAFLLYSRLAAQRGALNTALSYAKRSVKAISRVWANKDRSIRSISSSTSKSLESVTSGLSDLKLSPSEISDKAQDSSIFSANTGPAFWALIPCAFRSLLHLSSMFKHIGMFQETIYYAEQARKLAWSVCSEHHTAMALAVLGTHWLRAGSMEKGSAFLNEAKSVYLASEESIQSIIFQCQLAKPHQSSGDYESEISVYSKAELGLSKLFTRIVSFNIERPENQVDKIDEGASHLIVHDTQKSAPRKTKQRQTGAQKKASSIIKAVANPPEVSASSEYFAVFLLIGKLLRLKAEAMLGQKNQQAALKILEKSESHTTTPAGLLDQQLIMAKTLFIQAIEQMATDPVFSVIQDSTISFPSISCTTKGDKTIAGAAGVRLSSGIRTSPPAKPVAQKLRAGARNKSHLPSAFIDTLQKAYEILWTAQSTAIVIGATNLIYKASALLSTIVTILSVVSFNKGVLHQHPSILNCCPDIARIVAFEREQRVIQWTPKGQSQEDSVLWPQHGLKVENEPTADFVNEVSRFQRDFIDIIPHAWTAVSLSLNENRNELCLTRFKAGESPFILRLPLGRNSLRDADDDVFDFDQGKSEMLDIINEANDSAHATKDVTSKGAKTAWWERRIALDARLQDLLENIEKVWLGGFRGIFSQHSRKPDLLARFQQSFQNVLHKHLPSRQQKRKSKAKIPVVILDPRILELFVGLGDVTNEDCDVDEPLMDLLYFVVDILQFQGERNAYDEIDFDSMVVETHDALRCYHDALNSSTTSSDENSHTILILDKALHAFPWESLPCMEGAAVSRLPSLGCLRERILAQRDTAADAAATTTTAAREPAVAGHFIDRGNGSYILNPEGDLASTQAAFEAPLHSMKGWVGLVRERPSEADMRARLQSRDLLLYFGHGSGAQYVRSSTIRKLGLGPGPGGPRRCAVAVLMGCSSGALVDAGEFEPHGPPVNYLLAGCPALVATMWDVTDKDIDRFARSAFDEWGLFDGDDDDDDHAEVLDEKRAKGKGKAKKRPEGKAAEERDKEKKEKQKVSLVEAVARGKSACSLKYLTGAAVCVYGIPVYFR